jgi:hypothetical protein
MNCFLPGPKVNKTLVPYKLILKTDNGIMPYHQSGSSISSSTLAFLPFAFEFSSLGSPLMFI